MIYEITLTDACTRHCDFCTLKQNNYIESIVNIEKYYNDIMKIQQSRGNKHFIVSLFGGEPLLNILGIEKCIELFKDQNCDIMLYTNGDLIDTIYNKDFLQHLTIQISAYEIFSNHLKYQTMLSMLQSKCKHIQLAYTFSQLDISKINDFIDICKKLNVDYKISISHTTDSWNEISYEDLYKYVFNYFYNAIDNFYNKQYSFILPLPIKKEFTQAIDLIFNYKANIKTCLSQNKYVFFHGLHVGPCIKMFHKHIENEIPNGCIDCKYKNVCSKSCLAEHVNHTVPMKLCAIEKAKIEAALSVINKYSTEYKMRKLVQYQINKMNNAI